MPKCPYCFKSDAVKSNGYCDSRMAVLKDDICFVFAREYSCSDCQQKKRLVDNSWRYNFNGFSDSVISLYPDHIRPELQFIYTHRLAVHKSIAIDLIDNIQNGKSFRASRFEIFQRHKHKFLTDSLIFYNHRKFEIKSFQQTITKQQ